jgi:hypothetical protein
MFTPALRICCVLTVLCFLCALLSANGRAGLFGDPLDGVSTVLAEEERSHEDERPGKEGAEDTYGAHLSHHHALSAGATDADGLAGDGRAWRLLAGVRAPLLRPPLA